MKEKDNSEKILNKREAGKTNKSRNLLLGKGKRKPVAKTSANTCHAKTPVEDCKKDNPDDQALTIKGTISFSGQIWPHKIVIPLQNTKEILETIRSFSNLDLTGADLRGADLEGVVLSWKDLTGANLRGANLKGANLRFADLRGTDLYGADLEGANLKEANLEEANLYLANLTNTIMPDNWKKIVNRH